MAGLDIYAKKDGKFVKVAGPMSQEEAYEFMEKHKDE